MPSLPLSISTPPTTQPASQHHLGAAADDIATLSDTTLAVSTLNTLDGNTSGTIDASSVTTLTGAAADLNTTYDSSRLHLRLGNEAVTLSDTTLAVSVLNTLDSNTSGTIDANSVTTLTGCRSRSQHCLRLSRHQQSRQ